MAEATAAAECALWKKKPTQSAEGISSAPHWSGKACSDTFFTPPIRSFRDGMSFRRQRGRFLIKLACRWSRIAGIESHFNLARQRPSKPNWRALLRRRPLPRAPARPYQTTPKSRTTRRSSLQTRLPSQLHRDLQPQHERVVRLVEPAGPNNVLDVRLDGKSPLNLKIC